MPCTVARGKLCKELRHKRCYMVRLRAPFRPHASFWAPANELRPQVETRAAHWQAVACTAVQHLLYLHLSPGLICARHTLKLLLSTARTEEERQEGIKR